MSRAAVSDRLEFDVVVVGAGPSGCALAARLADARPGWRIALIEAGPAKGGLISDCPIGIVQAVGARSAINYAYETAPQTHLDGRRCFQPRGRGLGGSTLINAMCFTRGHAQDYDDWAAAGCTGWSWREVLPLFRRSEDNSRGESELHGAGGPLAVSDLLAPSPVTRAFVEAGVQAGLPFNPDFNGPVQDGVGIFQVFQRGGRRASAAAGYLSKPRANLAVLADAQAQRVTFVEGRASGVEVRTRAGLRTIGAAKEVVLCGGAFGTPQLLMLSGIGPAAHLRGFDLPVIADRPEVGANLQDHLDHVVSVQLRDAPGTFGFTPLALWRTLAALPAYLGGRGGMISSNIAEGCGFLRSGPEQTRPDIQLHFCVAIVDDHGRRRHLNTGVSLHACVLDPESRGTVRLAGPDPRAAPVIDPCYLSAPNDLVRLMKGVREAQRILTRPALARFGGKALYVPLDCDDEALAADIRARADTIYHPAGTCRMGADEAAPATPELRVRGVEGLRVADASIMPTLVRGNTEAPCAMIGEKAAELIAAA